MIPKKFHKHGLASLQSLATNQKRLVMGFDLYHTMMRLMTQAYELTPHAHVPEWSYDALKDVVSHDRTCAEARIYHHIALAWRSRISNILDLGLPRRSILGMLQPTEVLTYPFRLNGS